jgi:hypothetical protein
MPSDGEDDPGEWAEWAQEQGLERFERLRSTRQAMLNITVVLLWHLMEQQMLSFHRRQVLSIGEENNILQDRKAHRKLHNLREFEKRLEQAGVGLSKLPTWDRIIEVRLVANTVKHAAGESAHALMDRRPDLFRDSDIEDETLLFAPRPEDIEHPAGGDDLYVTEADLDVYFAAAVEFWKGFSRMIDP